MNFAVFSQYLQNLENENSRLAMTEILADFLKKLGEDEIENAVYLMQGSLVPSYKSLEFQMSSKMLIKSLARFQSNFSKEQESGENLFADSGFVMDFSGLEKKLEERFKELGDIGQLFEEILSSTERDNLRDLEIDVVYQKLKEIALLSGSGSQDQKISHLADLLMILDAKSTKFISRIVLGKMRLGFSSMTILDALSWAELGTKDDAKTLERAYQKKADLGKLAKAYLIDNKDLSADNLLNEYQVELGVPVVLALCQRLNSAQEIIDKMGPVLAEPKYDGLRIQIHINKAGFADSGLKYKAFTRNLEDVSHMFPELSKLATELAVENCILDSEAIGINTKTGEFLPFQETIQRKRKHGVADKAQELPIRFYVFDILMLNGERFIDENLDFRKEKLAKLIPNEESTVVRKTAFIVTEDPEELKAFHHQQLQDGLEGAVMKMPSSKYVAGRKGWRWVKIKEEEGQRGKLSDTLDCVMMGYYFGKGKRQSFGIGALLVGVVEKVDDDFVIKSISKIGTGLTDDQFREIKRLADENLSLNNKKPSLYKVDKNLAADKWLEPSLVLEIAADEITKSPIHKAGVALRFPRLIKIRKDKSWEEATSMEELKNIKIS